MELQGNPKYNNYKQRTAYHSKYRTVAKIPFAMLDIHQPGNSESRDAALRDPTPSQTATFLRALANEFESGSN
jgi:hypothetical protein